MFNSNLNLQGRFKFSVFNRNNALKYSTDDLPNFITSTGLNYPFSFAFADCFRYLSIGSGTGANSITIGSDTTGLQSGFNQSGYSYVGGGGGCASTDHTRASEYVSAGCGYRINNTGITLSRAWRIPDGQDVFFSSDTLVREYMLTPGRPYTTGWTGSPPTRASYNLCSCGDSAFSTPDGYNYTYGREGSQIADYYADIFPICTATKAFTRILKDISVLTDEYLVVNYSLDINYNTGIRSFNLGIDRSDSAAGEILNWSGNGRLSGIYSIVHPGLKLINDASFNGVSYVNDIWNAAPRDGESFVPPLGDVLEPSLPRDKRIAYISSDNLQFIVNDLSGGAMPTGSYFPYNSNGRPFPSGVMGFHRNWITESTTNGSLYLGSKVLDPIPYFVNPRTSNNTPYAYYADPIGYKNAQVVSPITLSHLESSPALDSIQQDSYIASDRNRGILLSYQWKNAGLASNFPVRAFVLGYNYDGGATDYWYPFLDTLFAPVTGTIEPAINTGDFTYASPSNMISPTNTSGHYFMDASNILMLQFRIAWSSPCSSTVIGCP